jgi:hypothetical protein
VAFYGSQESDRNLREELLAKSALPDSETGNGAGITSDMAISR